MALFVLNIVLGLLSAIAQSLAVERNQSGVPCGSIPAPGLPGIEILFINSIEKSVSAVAPPVGTFKAYPHLTFNKTFSVCYTKIIYKHVNVNDSIIVDIYLPLQGWNGRFEGVAGGGFSGGLSEAGLSAPAAQGYACATTDTGNFGSPNVTTAGMDFHLFAPPGQNYIELGDNNQLLNLATYADFSSRALHEMAILGKTVTKLFYGTAPKYSYFAGCSGGGRQAYQIAQTYPRDYDGILGGAPGVFWNPFIMSILWPQVVMHDAGIFLPQCVFAAFQKTFIDECDGLDGVIDGVIGNPALCYFNPVELVGMSISCGEEKVIISQDMANIIQRIHNGPITSTGKKLWFGLNKGSNYTMMAITTTLSNGTTIGVPSILPTTWIKYLLKGDPDFDVNRLSITEFIELMAQTFLQYDPFSGTNNPDLSNLRDSGTKFLSYHGLADEIIMPNGTLYYRYLVDSIMGGPKMVNEYFRLFMVPGFGHCSGGYGPDPDNPLIDLIAWVEEGKIPETLPASYNDRSGDLWKQNICSYPLMSKYDGKSDPKLANSYTCETSF